ncbi:Binding partner of ACD11 1 [Linum perenne]
MQTTRTVQVKELSDLAGEREIHEFFSFSGEIEHIQIHRDNGKSAFVTFKDAKALEIALLLSQEQPSPPRGRVYVNKAQVVVTNMLAKGSAISQDAVNKAKAFDEKHRLTASASDKVISFNRRVKLKEKLAVGISAVNEKVKSVDQKLHVSDRTMAAIFAAETKINNTGSAVKSNRYVTAGSAWLSGAFGKVAKAG